jgi:hypothetical protein
MGLAGAAWWVSGDGEQGVSGTDHLVNQVWIERVPADHRDQIAHLLMIDHPRARRVGVAGRSSQWRHMIEVFMWRLDGSTLDLAFPQDRVRSRLQARTWDCEGDAPEPFELCLELSRGDRKVRMYSRHEWEVDPQHASADLRELMNDHVELRAVDGTLDVASALPDEATQIDASDWPETDRLP